MKVTLNDIAKKMNVNPSTVQRALNGVDGVSDKKREEIQRVAKELGYKKNINAASLKMGKQRIAVVLPDCNTSNRFYSVYLWEGIEKCLAEITTVSIDVVRLTYEISPIDQITRLEEILKGEHGEIVGIVTRGSRSSELSKCLDKFAKKNIPVVLAGADSEQTRRICCVKNYEMMAGRMAADLLLNFGTMTDQSRMIVCGNFTTLNQYNNSLGFEQQLWENNVRPNITKITSDIDSAYIKDSLNDILNSGLDVAAIYACSARSTISVCEAVHENKMADKVRIIGSDLFSESADLIRKDILNATLHNQPSAIAHQSLQVLIRYLTKEELSPPTTFEINSVIVMKSNLEYYSARDLFGNLNELTKSR